jgi:uncharacterized protein YecT (DUF1311 family)
MAEGRAEEGRYGAELELPASLKKLKTADAERLRKAQRAWIAYRDAHCNAEFELWEGGTGGHIALPQCRLTLTKARTAEIQETYSKYESE